MWGREWKKEGGGRAVPLLAHRALRKVLAGRAQYGTALPPLELPLGEEDLDELVGERVGEVGLCQGSARPRR